MDSSCELGQCFEYNGKQHCLCPKGYSGNACEEREEYMKCKFITLGFYTYCLLIYKPAM